MNKFYALSGTVAVIALITTLSACTKKSPETAQVAGNDGAAPVSAELTSASELKIEDLSEGKGDEVASGKTVTVHYTGWLTNGKKFDSSVDRNTPFKFILGVGQVIQGWDKGVAGMKVGGKRRLTIPSNLAYGDRGAGGTIPPKATLVFEVELLKVE